MMATMMVLVILNIVVVIEASWLHERWDPHEGYIDIGYIDFWDTLMHIYWYILKIVDVIEASCLQERWDLHEGRLSCWFELYCHGLPIQRLTIIMIVIIVMIVINIIIVVIIIMMIEYQWLCLPGCDVPILTEVVAPSPKMETSGRLQLIHEEALHKCTGCNFSGSHLRLCAQ